MVGADGSGLRPRLVSSGWHLNANAKCLVRVSTARPYATFYPAHTTCRLRDDGSPQPVDSVVWQADDGEDGDWAYTALGLYSRVRYRV